MSPPHALLPARQPQAVGTGSTRARLAGVIALVLGWLVGSAPPALAAGFGFEQVVEQAKQLAASGYQDPRSAVPRWLLDISYDQWRDIRFRPEQALWRDAKLPFSVQFFHAGLFYDRSVHINVVSGGEVAEVAFSPDQFDYGRNEFASRVPQDLGYAGFRLHYPIKTASYHDEVIVFLGASYFRGVGRDEGFGISARGLAIDTALYSGEEFPWFREFWLERPAPGAKQIVIYALLDSLRAAGAYRFVVHPGKQTRVDVDLKLFRRRAIKKLGIAPLTSMYLRGENDPEEGRDYRPEVHDSDGLLVASRTGEWLWRPLQDPAALSVTSFTLENPVGFGLLQRDRDFDHYQDLEARSEKRPSVWIATKGDWKTGRVELVEIPTRREVNDNVVAYWVPEPLPPVEEPIELAYTMSWYGDDPKRPPGGRVTATRHDAGTSPNAHRFVVDFEGGPLAKLPETAVLRGVVTANGSQADDAILEQQVVYNPVTGGWRLVFQIVTGRTDPVELRAFLQQGEGALTETWSYVLRTE